MVRRLETLLILVLMLAGSVLLTMGCEEGDSTSPVVTNSGDNNAFNFSDDSNGQSSATIPVPVKNSISLSRLNFLHRLHS
jgi:hypothetical protein